MACYINVSDMALRMGIEHKRQAASHRARIYISGASGCGNLFINKWLARRFRINVLPHFGAEDCDGVNCAWCKFLVDMWMDAEYEEPEVDWHNVPVDTLVRVRNDEDSPWVLQYFKEFDEERNYKFLAWSNGRTSKTAGGRRTGWKYCELVEVEDE